MPNVGRQRQRRLRPTDKNSSFEVSVSAVPCVIGARASSVVCGLSMLTIHAIRLLLATETVDVSVRCRTAGIARGLFMLKQWTLWCCAGQCGSTPLIVLIVSTICQKTLTCNCFRQLALEPLHKRLWAVLMKKILILSILTFTLVGCGKADNRYPADIVTTFVNSCQAGGGNSELCSCAIDHIQDKFTLDEFKKIETRMAVGDQEAIRKIADTMSSCRK